MRITSYTVRKMADLPVDVMCEFDGINDHLQAAFENYPALLYRVFVTWSRDSAPTSISVLAGPVITAWVDVALAGSGSWGNAVQRARTMFDYWLCVSPFLLVHDAFDEELWLSLGFRELEPPPTAQRPLRVFAYGDLPPLDELFRAYGLSWEKPERGCHEPLPPSPEMREAIDSLSRQLSSPSLPNE
ncbi:MAG: hypothetical protein HXY37_04845 [Chloroflexi bacterium]|nr:hypothetical protein [Chloroflexota bacterium]